MSADGVIVVDLEAGGLLRFEKAFVPNYGMTETTHPMNLGALVYALYTATDGLLPERILVGGREVHFKEANGLLCCAFGPRVLCDAALGDRMFTTLAIGALVRIAATPPDWVAIRLDKSRRKILVRREDRYQEVVRHRGADKELKKACSKRRVVIEDVWYPTPNTISCRSHSISLVAVHLAFPPSEQQQQSPFVSSHSLAALVREAVDLVPILF